MCSILDVHLRLYWCARGQGRLNRTERTIFHWSINRDLERVIHITRHSCVQVIRFPKYIHYIHRNENEKKQANSLIDRCLTSITTDC
jgi:hypothetical protein